MALAAGTIFNVQDTATTGNVNGALFNTANANFITDLAATVATGNAPVVTSATYTFVAGDVGAALYVKSGTNWTPGFYPIASVAGGAATLNATIGAAWQLNSATGLYQPSTVAGCATTASPTAGTYGVNYSMLDTAKLSITDAISVGSSTTLTSVTGSFTPAMVGNGLHLTTSGTGAFGLVGWYEIVSYNSATSIVTDRTTNSGTALAAGTANIGGAGRFNGLEDTFQAAIPGGSTGVITQVWVKKGTYTISGAISTAGGSGYWLGYTSVIGDTCSTSNRPTIACAGNAVSFSTTAARFYNFLFTTTAAAGVNAKAFVNCKIFNSSSTSARSAVNTGCTLVACEVISQNGTALAGSTGFYNAYGCYIHDSVTGHSNSNPTDGAQFIGNIFEACSSAASTIANLGTNTFANNTIYGREGKMGTGLGFTLANSPNNNIFNNIFYGLTTGISVTTGTTSTNLSQNNDFFNNTTDCTNWLKNNSDLALDPQFTGATQITGSTASGSGSVLTDTNANFSTVTDNVDFVRVLSGTGATVGNYLITGHTTTTLTCNNTVGTNAAADRVYFVTTGHNFQIGTNLKALGFNTFAAMGVETVSYPDVGAVQRQEGASGASGGSYTFVG